MWIGSDAHKTKRHVFGYFAMTQIYLLCCSTPARERLVNTFNFVSRADYSRLHSIITIQSLHAIQLTRRMDTMNSSETFMLHPFLQLYYFNFIELGNELRIEEIYGWQWKWKMSPTGGNFYEDFGILSSSRTLHPSPYVAASTQVQSHQIWEKLKIWWNIWTRVEWMKNATDMSGDSFRPDSGNLSCA